MCVYTYIYTHINFTYKKRYVLKTFLPKGGDISSRITVVILVDLGLYMV